MPKEWHDRHSVNSIEDLDKRRFYLSLVADKKPYFMRIIYPALMKQYNTYIKNTNKNAMREFQMSMKELLSIPGEDLTERQSDFIRYYHSRMPVSDNDCIMNRICRVFERTFDGYIGKYCSESDFDYRIMKSDAEYDKLQYNAIAKLYEEYNTRLRNSAIYANYERVDEYESFLRMEEMKAEFTEECTKICQNRFVLCNIVLDLCYTKSSTKRFAWEICGDEIIENLLSKSAGVITYPEADDNGEVEFQGKKFSVRKMQLETNESEG